MKLFLGAFHNLSSAVLKNALQNEKDIENAASLYWQPYFRGLKSVIYVNCAFEGTLDYKKAKKELRNNNGKTAFLDIQFGDNSDTDKVQMIDLLR